jgi:nucleoside-diphosphate-sugar epimerase
MAVVLIAGAGYVGSQLGLELARDGHEVFGLRRDPAALPPQIRGIAADVADPGLRHALPEHVDQVVYAVAAEAATPAAYQLAYVDGLARVLDAVHAGRRAPERVVFTSSTAVYGQRAGEWVDETSVAEPAHFTGQVLVQGETLLLGAGPAAVVLRLGGIYGPGRTRVIDQVRAGHVQLAAGSSAVNRIHRDDAAGAIRHVLALPAPSSVYLVVDDEPASQATLIDFIAERMGVRPMLEPIAADAARRGQRTNKRCSNHRLRSSGYAFQWPTYREGYGALVDERLATAQPGER